MLGKPIVVLGHGFLAGLRVRLKCEHALLSRNESCPRICILNTFQKDGDC